MIIVCSGSYRILINHRPVNGDTIEINFETSDVQAFKYDVADFLKSENALSVQVAGKMKLSETSTALDKYALIAVTYADVRRQHRRTTRESMDCATALQELVATGVKNIVTFDAHDPRVNNTIPLDGFDNVQAAYQMIKALLKNVPDIKLDREWYCSVNMSKYIALLVETLNYDNSISSLLGPVDRIKKIVAKYGQDK